MHTKVFNCILMNRMGLSALKLEYLDMCSPNFESLSQMGYQQLIAHCKASHQTHMDGIKWYGSISQGVMTANIISFDSDLLTKCLQFSRLWLQYGMTCHRWPHTSRGKEWPSKKQGAQGRDPRAPREKKI
jgi:hypothetical protein